MNYNKILESLNHDLNSCNSMLFLVFLFPLWIKCGCGYSVGTPFDFYQNSFKVIRAELSEDEDNWGSCGLGEWNGEMKGSNPTYSCTDGTYIINNTISDPGVFFNLTQSLSIQILAPQGREKCHPFWEKKENFKVSSSSKYFSGYDIIFYYKMEGFVDSADQLCWKPKISVHESSFKPQVFTRTLKFVKKGFLCL